MRTKRASLILTALLLEQFVSKQFVIIFFWDGDILANLQQLPVGSLKPCTLICFVSLSSLGQCTASRVFAPGRLSTYAGNLIDPAVDQSLEVCLCQLLVGKKDMNATFNHYHLHYNH